MFFSSITANGLESAERISKKKDSMEINSYEGYSRKMVRTIGIAAKPHLHASVWFHKTISTNDKSAICYSGQIPLGLTHMRENHHMHRWSTINKPNQLFFLCVCSLSLVESAICWLIFHRPNTNNAQTDAG